MWVRPGAGAGGTPGTVQITRGSSRRSALGHRYDLGQIALPTGPVHEEVSQAFFRAPGLRCPAQATRCLLRGDRARGCGHMGRPIELAPGKPSPRVRPRSHLGARQLALARRLKDHVPANGWGSTLPRVIVPRTWTGAWCWGWPGRSPSQLRDGTALVRRTRGKTYQGRQPVTDARLHAHRRTRTFHSEHGLMGPASLRPWEGGVGRGLPALKGGPAPRPALRGPTRRSLREGRVRLWRSWARDAAEAPRWSPRVRFVPRSSPARDLGLSADQRAALAELGEPENRARGRQHPLRSSTWRTPGRFNPGGDPAVSRLRPELSGKGRLRRVHPM